MFGTRPVPPADALRRLRDLQSQVVAASRFGIPAVAHEECLTGFAAWTGHHLPDAAGLGRVVRPGLVGEMAAAIGASMRAVGIHQGLAPVLDVTRDPRWGRTEETIGEDPYLVGTVGTAYVRGLQSAGIARHAEALRRVLGLPGRAQPGPGRHRPPRARRRDPGAVRDGAAAAGRRSVMPSYTDIDGVPVSADRDLLTGLLRDELGFDGVVVSDYFAIAFLQTAARRGRRRPRRPPRWPWRRAWTSSCPAWPATAPRWSSAVRDGLVAEEFGGPRRGPGAAAEVRPRPARSRLARPEPRRDRANGEVLDLDPPGHRALARRLAEESVVLLANRDASLPLHRNARIAVTGPLADDPLAFYGCYSMPRHLGGRYPRRPKARRPPPSSPRCAAELPAAQIDYAPGCAVREAGPLRVRARRRARAGGGRGGGRARRRGRPVRPRHLGRGLRRGRPAAARACRKTCCGSWSASGTPVVLVLVTGRPYAIGPVAGQLAGIVQAFFPGEEGGGAIAGVLSGRLVPSGRLPVEMPASPGGQPSSYLRPRLAARHPGSSVDPTPLFAFGHGLSYTSFAYSDLVIEQPEIGTDGTAVISCTVRNTGARAGAEVVQLYLSDPVAQVVRPARWLAGFARVPLEPGQARRVTFRLHADRTAFTGRDPSTGTRVVEPGEIRVAVGGASDQLPLQGSFMLCGPERAVGPGRVLDTPAEVSGPMSGAQ